MGATVVLPPPDDDWSVNMVTSAWKTNNGFPPDTHTQFHDVEHPRYIYCLLLLLFKYTISFPNHRFGLIPAMSAIKDIVTGEELLIDYGYAPQFENMTEGNHYWYYEARREHVKK